MDKQQTYYARTNYYEKNRAYILEKYRKNKVRCDLCEKELNEPAMKHHIVSKTHKIKMLEKLLNEKSSMN